MIYFDPRVTRIVTFSNPEEAEAFALPAKHSVTHDDPELQLRKRIADALSRMSDKCSLNGNALSAYHIQKATALVWETE